VGLKFGDEASATDALPLLNAAVAGGVSGAKWKLADSDRSTLVAFLEGDHLDALRAVFKEWGMTEENLKAIASIAHSIDYGDPFFGTIPIVPAEQEAVFR